MELFFITRCFAVSVSYRTARTRARNMRASISWSWLINSRLSARSTNAFKFIRRKNRLLLNNVCSVWLVEMWNFWWLVEMCLVMVTLVGWNMKFMGHSGQLKHETSGGGLLKCEISGGGWLRCETSGGGRLKCETSGGGCWNVKFLWWVENLQWRRLYTDIRMQILIAAFVNLYSLVPTMPGSVQIVANVSRVHWNRSDCGHCQKCWSYIWNVSNRWHLKLFRITSRIWMKLKDSGQASHAAKGPPGTNKDMILCGCSGCVWCVV